MLKDRILVVEDDADISDLIRDYFEINNYEVVIKRNGLEGCKEALEKEFDLIILDIMLPGMDGFEICKKLRETTDKPILFVSARSADVDVIRGMGIGADDYIKKPFSPSELVARATANLKRYRELKDYGQEKGENISFGNIKLDFNARRVYKKDEEVILANKEFELLEFFIRNPNKVFSRETLFTRIWDMTSFGDITTVTVHIKRLREKIEDTPQEPKYIETVWGAGYRFNLIDAV